MTGINGTLETTLAYWMALAEEVRRDRPRSLLVVDDMEGDPPPPEQLAEFVQAMVGLGFEGVRVAYVEAHAQQIPEVEHGEILARDGLLSMSALSRLARRLTEQPGKRVGEVLVEEGLGTADHVAWALRCQRASRLDALYNLTEALIRFHVPRPRAGQRALPLSPREFLHGRPRTRARPRVTERSAQNSKPGEGRARPRSGIVDERRVNAYRALGLTPSASPRDVQRAFRKLAAERHPDRFPEASSAEKAQLLLSFAQLSAAYHALID